MEAHDSLLGVLAGLLISPFVLGRTLIQTMLQEKISLPSRIWGRLNASWILFFLLMGAVNLAAVYNMSCNAWVNFKVLRVHRIDARVRPRAKLMLAGTVETPEQPR